MPLTHHLENLWHDVLDDLNISEYQQILLKPFMVFGFDVWRAGSLRTRFGALIGFPINFTYESIENVDKQSIVVNNDEVNWERRDAQKLLNSLILSDNAKKYAIAREITMVDSKHLIIESVTIAMLFGSCYGVTAAINDSLNLFAKSRSVRVPFYFLIGGFFYGLWSMQKDLLTRYYEMQCDQDLAQLGEVYIKGGLEFYDQMLKRNIALRTLMGSAGESLITIKGNENFLLRQKRLPITHRKKYFEDQLESFLKEKNLEQTTVTPKNVEVAEA